MDVVHSENVRKLQEFRVCIGRTLGIGFIHLDGGVGLAVARAEEIVKFRRVVGSDWLEYIYNV